MKQLAVAVAVLLAVAVIAAIPRMRGGDPIAQARTLANDDDAFATATSAGVTFAKVSRMLERAGDSCSDEDSAQASRCAALFAGAGYARVSAVGVLRCTLPARYDARRGLVAYLDAVAGDEAAHEPPPVVSC